MSELLYLLIVFAIPLGITALGLWLFFARRRWSWRNEVIYHYLIGGSRISITRGALYGVIIWIIPLIWAEYLLPLFFLPVTTVPLVVLLLLGRRRSVSVLDERLRNLLESYRSTSTTPQEAAQIAQAIGAELTLRSADLEDRTLRNRTLEEAISAKYREYESLRTLTDEQKRILISATGEVLNRRSAARTLAAAFIAVMLNLIATIIWTLAGSPGREKILQLFK